MSVKTETITEEQEKVVNDLPDSVQEDQAKMDELKALLKKKKEVMPPKIVETKKKSLKFGVLGSGQAGSKLAAQWYAASYPAVAINTAQQDLEFIELPNANKLLLEYTLGGACKDLSIGQAAAEANRDAIAALVDDKLSDSHVLLFCTSLGGGSGAGSTETIVDILTSTEKPVVVITVLPMTTEDAQTKNNALTTLSKLAKLAQQKVISNLIVVDNAKLEAIYSEVSHMDFFTVGNRAIVETIDAFNHYSASPSKDKPLDSMEFAKLFTDGEGLCVYGEMVVPDYSNDATSIAKAVLENLDNGLLASGFDLAQAKYGGIIIVANSEVWKSIPRGAIDYAVELVKESCSGTETVFRGTYIDDSIKDDVVKVYSMFSGLGLPDSRVSQLRKEVSAEAEKIKERAKSRNVNLTLDTGTEKTVSAAEQIKEKIAKGSSKFSKSFVFGNDFRKK